GDRGLLRVRVPADALLLPPVLLHRPQRPLLHVLQGLLTGCPGAEPPMVHVLVACRCLLAVVFAASAFGKLRSRRAFEEFTSATRRLAPGWAIRPLRGTG